MSQTPINRGRNWTLRIVILAVMLSILVIFIAENFVVVEVRFLAQRYEVRLAWAVLVAGIVGLVTGLGLPKLWR